LDNTEEETGCLIPEAYPEKPTNTDERRTTFFDDQKGDLFPQSISLDGTF